MKRKGLLSLLLSAALIFSFAPIVKAEDTKVNVDSEQSGENSARAGDQMIDALETVTIGKAKYRLYTCTLLLSTASEGKLSVEFKGYVNATEADKDRISGLSKTLSLSNVRASFLGGSDRVSSNSRSITGLSGEFSHQSGIGSGILYFGTSTGTFSYADGSWTRNTSCSRLPGV